MTAVVPTCQVVDDDGNPIVPVANTWTGHAPWQCPGCGRWHSPRSLFCDCQRGATRLPDGAASMGG